MNKEENNADECYWDETGEWEGSCTFCCKDNMCNLKERTEANDDDKDDCGNLIFFICPRFCR